MLWVIKKVVCCKETTNSHCSSLSKICHEDTHYISVIRQRKDIFHLNTSQTELGMEKCNS